MKRSLAALAALFFAASAQAGRLVDMQIVDRDTGVTLPSYGRDARQWIAGEPGHRYAVVLQNMTSERVLAVLSIDGVNAVSGQTAGAQQSGYVLGPWERAEIKGWRKSMSDVAEFYFTDLPDSYAARTGRPDNVGVIGVAAFRERSVPRPAPQPAPPVAYGDRYEKSRERDAAAAESAPAAPRAGAGIGGNTGSAKRYSEPSASDGLAQQELGTGHGARRYDPTEYTTFERATRHPAEVVSLYYDSYRALAERGIVPPPRRPHPVVREPDPFPVGFVPDPRW